jgi:c-di-GMP-binding flagellar brake protein YcgR
MAKELADTKAQESSYERGELNKPFFFSTGIPLHVEISGVPFRMKSISVGCVPDTCLVMRYPAAPMSIARMLFKGNKIIVRYIDGGNAVGFESELMGVADEPVKILYISYPMRIEGKNLRSSRRVECYLPAHVFRRDSGQETPLGEGIIVDISRTGCAFAMASEPCDEALTSVRIGDTVVLGCQLPGTEKNIVLDGEVRRIQRDAERTITGIQFHEMEENLKGKIMDYISALEKFDRETY